MSQLADGVDIIAAAWSNDAFRRVVITGAHQQVVVMTIPPGGEIGDEVHPDTDQALAFVDGRGHPRVVGVDSAGHRRGIWSDRGMGGTQIVPHVLHGVAVAILVVIGLGLVRQQAQVSLAATGSGVDAPVETAVAAGQERGQRRLDGPRSGGGLIRWPS